jgi:hypothetical protein
MGTKSRKSIYGSSTRASAERAKEARNDADKLACDAWNQRMLGYKGPAQPSSTLGDALNAGYGYLEVRCLACNNHQTVALDIVAGRSPQRSMNWNATCAARIVCRYAAIRSSEAISSRSGQRRYQRAIYQ